MPLFIITPTKAARDIVVASQSIATVARSIRLRFTVPQLDIGAFSTEQNGPLYQAGITMAVLTANSLLGGGATGAVPLIPPPQGVAVTVNYVVVSGTATCSIAFSSMNFEEASADYDYGQAGQAPVVGRSSSSYTVTWASS